MLASDGATALWETGRKPELKPEGSHVNLDPEVNEVNVYTEGHYPTVCSKYVSLNWLKTGSNQFR